MKSRALSGLRSAVSFLTIIPAGSDYISDYAHYFFSITGIATGLIAGLVYFTADFYFGNLVGASLALAALLLVSGFTHLDGVLDSGDALMARGDLEKRRAVMKDHFLGAGAIGTAMVIYIPTFAFLTLFSPFTGLMVIIMAETLSKFSMITMLAGCSTFGDGLAKRFKTSMGKRSGITVLVNVVPPIVLTFLMFPQFLLAFIMAIVISIISSRVLEHIFHGVNGDLIGLNAEFSRLVYLASFALLMVTLFR
ncbi:MAG: adenosylcobinamide-GDP ribazoletransferase [Thermoplasmata archaeon]